MSRDELLQALQPEFSVAVPDDLSIKQASDLIDRIQKSRPLWRCSKAGGLYGRRDFPRGDIYQPRINSRCRPSPPSPP